MKNKFMKVVVYLQLLAISVLLSGCWDSTQIDDRALILGLAIDEAGPEASKKEDLANHKERDVKQLNKNMIRLTAQIAVPGRVPLGPGNGGSSDSKKSSPVWVVQVVGHTIEDAMNNLQQEIADPRFLEHLRIIVISENIAERGLDDLNDVFRRNAQVRRSTWLLVTDTKASDLMEVAPPLERVPTLYVLSMLEKSVEMGKFPEMYLSHFWNNGSKLGQNPFLPYISIREGENILINGFAFFRNNKMVGTTSSPIEIGVYMAAKGINPGGYTVLFPVQDTGYVMVRAKKRKSYTKVRIQNGKPHADIDVYIHGELVEKLSANTNIDTTLDLKKIEEEQERRTTTAINDLIKETQKVKSDIFGLGEYVRAHERSYWNENVRAKNDWENLYAGMSIHVNVKVNIRRVGMKVK
ncbi:Ger(x)C family spore germination protein [Paenibacillus sp. FSL W7-1332]|uniref:Ger(x)C family spore germination protein n=1 Tax=Paenibacillus sp. FSL W7-1332 TaxID=2921702 RepID=UPI0030D2510B